jgi:transcriptional regulator with XRE-family HTH domain
VAETSNLESAATAAEEAGQRLKQARELLGLRYRDVEQASLSIAQKLQNDEFALALSRLADIENKGLVPTIYRLYTLCAIYKLDFPAVLGWYGVDLSRLPADGMAVDIDRTHLIGFSAPDDGLVDVPLSLDPGLDIRKTTDLSRMIQQWGKLPLSMLGVLDIPACRYGLVGSDDWFLYPLLMPGSLVLIDHTKKKPAMTGWLTEFERPIYFCEHADGFHCAWCTLEGDKLILQPHPASGCSPLVFRFPEEIDILGQVTRVAMSLDRKRKPRSQP